MNYHKFRKGARNYCMGNITIKDIAKIAGVSYSTVSRALSGAPGISSATRERIIKICDEKGYRANALARSLINKKTNVLGLIVPEVTNPFYSELSLEIETYARKLGYNIMLCNSLNDHARTEELFNFLLSHRVDGILHASSRIYSADMLKNYSSSIPFILIGTAPAECNSILNTISTDNYEGGRIAAQYLLSLGHRDIFYMGYREGSTSHQLRLLGFNSVMEEAGLKPVILENPSNGSSIAKGYELCRPVFSKPFRQTAMFAATDSMALGAMKAAGEYHISIPGDLSLLSYDNTIFSSLPRISLSTVDQRKQLLARAAVDLMMQLLGHPFNDQHMHQLIRPSLVIRNSCRELTSKGG
jgi:LacI family transcriptional regulator